MKTKVKYPKYYYIGLHQNFVVLSCPINHISPINHIMSPQIYGLTYGRVLIP